MGGGEGSFRDRLEPQQCSDTDMGYTADVLD